MSTLAELLKVMKGKSLTLGWDAIVAYNRDKANALLLEQTIERLQTTNGYIQPISGELKLQDGADTRLYLTGLQLGAPVLSFESSQRRSQTATLRFPIVHGMTMTTIKTQGRFEQVIRLEQQSPLARGMLTMHLDLHRSGGGVNAGSVFIELNEATGITSTFGNDDATRRAVAAFFTALFKGLDSGRRRYELGTIGKAPVPELTPVAFEVRTVTRTPGAQPGAQDYGDGAIEVFIRFQGGAAGNTPGLDFPLLLPDGFSGSLLLSSRVLFDKVLKPRLQTDIGRGIRFAEHTAGSDNAWVLKANAGEFTAPFDYHYKARSDDFDAVFSTDMRTSFGPEGIHSAFTVQSDGERLSVNWKKTTSTRFSRFIDVDWPWPDQWDYGDLHFSYDFSKGFPLVLESNGVVAFRRDAGEQFNLTMSGHESLPDLGGGDRSKINEVAKEHFLPAVIKMFEKIQPPAIDTFVARNLLFPGRNALVPSQAHLPGDLFVVGQIDQPFALRPEQSMVVAGGNLTFSTHPQQQGITWSLSGIRGQQGGLGTISSSGRYQAPPAGILKQSSMTVVVTASKGQGSTQTSVSTLLDVVRETVGVSPLLQVCNVEQTRSFSAFALGGGGVDARLDSAGNGGTLTRTSDTHWTYRAGPKVSGWAVVLDPITVTDRGTGTSKKTYVLVIHRLLTLRLTLDEPVPGQGGPLRAFIEDEEIPAAEMTWTLTGEGRIDGGNRYVPAVNSVAGFDVVVGSAGSGSRADWGYLVIPQLSAYPKGLQVRRDVFGTLYVSWDAMTAVVEYEVEGFERKVTTKALSCLLLLAPFGIAPVSLRGRYADGRWSATLSVRFINLADSISSD